MDAYKVLGIAKGADQKEIKRAYFRLVRQFSPEHDPERFQEIREAYEALMAGGEEEQTGFSLEFPDCLLAKQMSEVCQNGLKQGDYKRVMRTAEEALTRLGESEGFLYFLAKSQLHIGNTGKAVRNLERLVNLHPDKIEFRRLLAIAYQRRGYANKAYEAFCMAYDMGCRENEFLMMFSICCSDRGWPAQGIQVLEELLNGFGKNVKEHMDEALNAFMGLIMMALYSEAHAFPGISERFQGFLKSAAPYLAEYKQELQQIFFVLIEGANREIWEASQVKQILGEADRQGLGETLGESWKEMEQELENCIIRGDERLADVLKRGYEGFVLSDNEDEQLVRFMQLDVMLCMLEEWPGIRAQIEILRNDYAAYYEKIREFVETLERTGDMERLRERLQNDYDRRAKYIDGGFYYEEYPHRKKRQQTTRWDSDEEGTYVRGQAKIGRNAPCPCGSGKKYKNCCGRTA